MHTAPAVDYPVGRSRFQTLALLSVWSCVTAAYVLWFAQSASVGWQHAFGLCVAAFTALFAIRAWRATPVGVLEWDGQSWWWEASGRRSSGSVAPCLDFQRVLLLSFDAASGPRQWLWLDRSTAQARWIALRCAVHARERVQSVASAALTKP